MVFILKVFPGSVDLLPVSLPPRSCRCTGDGTVRVGLVTCRSETLWRAGPEGLRATDERVTGAACHRPGTSGSAPLPPQHVDLRSP